MNRFLTVVCVVAALLFAAEPVVAQAKTKPKEKKEDSPKIEVVKDEEIVAPPVEDFPLDTTAVPQDELTSALAELLEITHSLDLGTQFGKALLDQKNDPRNTLPTEFYDRLFKEFENGETARWYKNAVIRVYRKFYTLEDTRQILTFYKTPAGQKMISTMPQLLTASMKEGENLGRYIGMKVYNEMRKEGKF
jgi:uncharacterized protein